MAESVVLIIDGLAVRTKIGKIGVEKLFDALEKGKAEWVALSEGDGEIRVRLDRISAVQIKTETMDGESLKGVSVKEICEAASDIWKYPTLVRKVNKDGGFDLEMASPRRVLLSDRNIEVLGLSARHVAKLRKIENARQ